MINLTQRAASHVQEMLRKRGHGIGLRLATHKTGCSGFAYAVDYADQVKTDDVVFESHDIKIIIDKQSLPMMNGSEVDFQPNGSFNQGFEFHNPNAREVCGCGESFNI